jgi:hypothetical protein
MTILPSKSWHEIMKSGSFRCVRLKGRPISESHPSAGLFKNVVWTYDGNHE